SVWTFDSSGQLIGDQEQGKPTLTVTQSAFGPAAILGPDGAPVLLFDYDSSSGRLVSVTDVPSRDGEAVAPRAVHFTYDDRGRPSTVANREGATTQYAYSG